MDINLEAIINLLKRPETLGVLTFLYHLGRGIVLAKKADKPGQPVGKLEQQEAMLKTALDMANDYKANLEKALREIDGLKRENQALRETLGLKQPEEVLPHALPAPSIGQEAGKAVSGSNEG